MRQPSSHEGGPGAGAVAGDRDLGDDRAFFGDVFRASPCPTAVRAARDGAYVAVNDAFVALTGFDRAEILGRSPADLGLWSADDDAAMTAAVERGERVEDRELSLRTRAGAERVVSISRAAAELRGQACSIDVVRDVTERRRLLQAFRESESRAAAAAEEVRALLDVLPAVVWIARDPECRDVTGSRAAHEVLRMRFGENLSKTGPDPTPVAHFTVHAGGREIPPEELPLQVCARTGVEVRDFGEEIVFDDGTRTHLIGNTVPLRDAEGRTTGAVAAFFDITRVREAEAARLAEERRAGELRERLMAIVSHDLRNPLGSILMAATVLVRRRLVTADGMKLVDRILKNGGRMQRMIEQLLDYVRIEHHGAFALDRRPCDLCEIADSAVEETELAFPSRTIEVVRLAADTRGSWDADRLFQVIVNLLGNALQHSTGAVRLTVGANEGAAWLETHNEGPVIPKEALADLFEAFRQGGAPSARGGLGLGLYIANQIVRAHGGSLVARSNEDGTTFRVELPRL